MVTPTELVVVAWSVHLGNLDHTSNPTPQLLDGSGPGSNLRVPLLISYMTSGKAAQEDPPCVAHPGKHFLFISHPHIGPPPNILK